MKVKMKNWSLGTCSWSLTLIFPSSSFSPNMIQRIKIWINVCINNFISSNQIIAERILHDPIRDALKTTLEKETLQNIPSNFHRKVITHNFMVHTVKTSQVDVFFIVGKVFPCREPENPREILENSHESKTSSKHWRPSLSIRQCCLPRLSD